MLIDACTLQNFAVVDGLRVLEGRYSGRARWTEAVRYEIRRGVAAEPLLQEVLDLEAGWLGAPLRLDQPGDEEVDLIRRGLGGRSAEPLKHLGEAESIHVLERADGPNRVFVSDDAATTDFVLRRSSGVRVVDAADVLAQAYGAGELDCPEAYELLQAMLAYPRGVRVPPTVRSAEPCRSSAAWRYDAVVRFRQAGTAPAPDRPKSSTTEPGALTSAVNRVRTSDAATHDERDRLSVAQCEQEA